MVPRIICTQVPDHMSNFYKKQSDSESDLIRTFFAFENLQNTFYNFSLGLWVLHFYLLEYIDHVE